ncbi:MAG: DUF4355 domain-containing protein [Defluviitaleaceae bacterium]|nr:DUF4355 domain-containing protein [Defluviitaleaceae bacterium]
MKKFNTSILDNDFKEKEEYLTKLEIELLKKELLNEAKARFLERNLPYSLLDCIRLDSLEELDSSIEILEQEFLKAVEAEVSNRLSTYEPKITKNYNQDPFLQGLNR